MFIRLISNLHGLHLCLVFAPRWWGQSSLTGTLLVTLLLYICSPPGKPVGAFSSGQGEEVVSTSVDAGDCMK